MRHVGDKNARQARPGLEMRLEFTQRRRKTACCIDTPEVDGFNLTQQTLLRIPVIPPSIDVRLPSEAI